MFLAYRFTGCRPGRHATNHLELNPDPLYIIGQALFRQHERVFLERAGTELKGVGGWLLLLCVTLTVLDPSAVLINLFFVADAAKPYFARHPGFFRLILVNGVAGIALSVFSLYAGISLWKRFPGALDVARKYLKTVFAYSLIAPFLPRLVGSTFHASDETFVINCLNSLFTIIYTGIWYFYLNRSARVRTTYSENR